jgi:hypothetical protein
MVQFALRGEGYMEAIVCTKLTDIA